tara:strand:- start:702 stop:1166 length:465 start_codon:yes stop_codon:yes gene_type:complete
MSKEVERRFLIKNNNWEKLVQRKTNIKQAYLFTNTEGWLVRIRSENEEFTLTLKKHIDYASNFEFEYKIPKKDGTDIISNINNLIIKERFYLLIDEKEWIVDRFKGKNFPLEIAEIELKNIKEKIELPSFISEEITGLKEFSNLELSNIPFSTW